MQNGVAEVDYSVHTGPLLHKLMGLIEVSILETAEKEVQNTSYRGSGGVPQL